MTYEEFKALKGKERFTNDDDYPGRVFTVDRTSKDGAVHSTCGHTFWWLDRLTLLPPEPEQAGAEQPKPILIRANEIINGDRARDYGPSSENLERLAQRWSQVFGVPVTHEQVCMAMIDLKLSRLIVSPNHEDSWLDIAGYVGVMDKARRGE